MTEMVSPIVVIGMQRSGTTVFRQLLAANGADDYGEVFHAQFLNNPKNFFWFVYKKTQADPAFLHPTMYPHLFKTFITENISATRDEHVLLDIKYNALRIIDMGMSEAVPTTIRFLEEQGATFLHIIRRNALRIFVSKCIALKTGLWRETSSKQVPLEDKKLLIPPGEALLAVEAHERQETQVRGWLESRRSEVLVYEEMFEKDGTFSEKALAIAGALLNKTVPKNSTEKVALKKQNAEPLAEYVLNFKQLTTVFHNTPYAWMLDE